MTTNPITELAADLRSLHEYLEEGGDRGLTSPLRAAAVLNAVAPIMALDWPCDTCGGKGLSITPDSVGHAFAAVLNDGRGAGLSHLRCPDCVDGQVPFDARVRKLLAVWEAVHGSRQIGGLSADDLNAWLRQIGRDA